jgi:hypothetical protein
MTQNKMVLEDIRKMLELARSQNGKIIGRNKRLMTPLSCTKWNNNNNNNRNAVYCEMFNNSYFGLYIQ